MAEAQEKAHSASATLEEFDASDSEKLKLRLKTQYCMIFIESRQDLML